MSDRREPVRRIVSPSGRLTVLAPFSMRERRGGWIFYPTDESVLQHARKALAVVIPRLRVPAWVGEHRIPQRFAETLQTQELTLDP